MQDAQPSRTTGNAILADSPEVERMIAEAVAAALQKRIPDTPPSDPSKYVRAMVDAAVQAQLSARPATASTPTPATASNSNNPTAEFSVTSQEIDAIDGREQNTQVPLKNDLERKLIAEAVAKAILEFTASGSTSEAGASAASVSGLATRAEEYQPGDYESLSYPPKQEQSLDGPAGKSPQNVNLSVPTGEVKSPTAPLPRVAPSVSANQFREYLIAQDTEEGISRGYGMIILLAVLGASTVVAIIGVIRGW